jgi:hypothetical protein
MKTSVKKSAIFVMMAALVVLSAIAIYSCGNSSSAQDMGYFQGDYAVTGTNPIINTDESSLVAIPGFTNMYTLANSSLPYSITHGCILGNISFHPDGTGEFRSRFTGTVIPSPFDPTNILVVESHFDYNFTYTVSPQGVISFSVLPCAGSPGAWNNDGPHDGVISPDHQSLIVYCGGPPIFIHSCTLDSCADGVAAPGECTETAGIIAGGIQMQGFRIAAPFPIPHL